NRGHAPAFLADEQPRRHVSVSPFVRSYEWYLLPDADRRRMPAEHGAMARDYPDVRANTVASFSPSDYAGGRTAGGRRRAGGGRLGGGRWTVASGAGRGRCGAGGGGAGPGAVRGGAGVRCGAGSAVRGSAAAPRAASAGERGVPPA